MEMRSDGRIVRGELIAVHADTVYVLNDSLTAVAKDIISNATLLGYGSQWGRLGLWTALGILSTASHGFFLILSTPVWLIGGTAATATQSRQPRLQVPKLAWASLNEYARFPAGLPPSLARGSFRRATLQD